MEFYIFTLFIFGVLSLFEFGNAIPQKLKKTLFFICFLIIVIQVGFRWETGTDWPNYFRAYFGLLTEYDEVYVISATERGYDLLVTFSKLIVTNYTFFLTLHAFLYLGMIFYFIKKFSPYIFASTLLFYAITLGIWGSNRQLLAVGICLVSLQYLYEGKKKIFLLFVFFATFFHVTAILFLICYFADRNFNKGLIITTLLLCYIIGQTSIPLSVFSVYGNNFDSAKINDYVANAQELKGKLESSTLGLIKRLLLFYIFTKSYDTILVKYPKYKIPYNIYFISLAFYFIFYKSLMVMSSRGGIYFNLVEIVLLPFVITTIKDANLRTFSSIILFSYAVLIMYQSIEVYPDIFIPYKGLFYNIDYHRK